MIVVDASAVVAVLNEEAGHEHVAQRLLARNDRVISPVSAVEVTMVLARRFKDPSAVADAYYARAQIHVHPIDTAQADAARLAFLLFGKGRHPARLNLGDCFSYAAAKVLNAPLLYVGGDFARTDIRAA